MARIRTVKPELFSHEALFDAERETGLPLRLAFIGLFTCCDKQGRFKWRPRSLKLDVLPYDDCDFSRVLDALMTRGFLVKYEHEGDEYGCIPTFTTHQVINNREKDSTLPDPEQCRVISTGCTRQSRVDDASITRHKGKGTGKGGGKEQEGNTRPDDASGASPSFSAKSALIAEGVPDTVADDYLKIRKAKKAPFTATALDGLKREAARAGMSVPDAVAMCCERGWQGFRAEWLVNARDKVPRPAASNNHTNFQEKTYVGTPDDEIDWLSPGDGQGEAKPVADDVLKARQSPVE